MGDLVAKVTRAQYHAVPRNKPFEKLSAFQREQAMAQARAAIAVCMEEAAKVPMSFAKKQAALHTRKRMGLRSPYSARPLALQGIRIASAIRALQDGGKADG